MPIFIIKITDEKAKKDYYLEWSSNIDAPVARGLELGDFKSMYAEKYSAEDFRELPLRLARVEATGSSSLYAQHDTLADFLNYNCAGENGETLDKEGLLNKYCRDKN